ncbi:M15 family metallopeptidase [Nonlabens spongiae]|nr:M15 family metallopeptidase [Nonlabens spongiae]
MIKWFLYIMIGSQIMNAQTLKDTLIGKADLGNKSIPLEVQKAFDEMRAAAIKDGINLTIVSGYRSYERQEQIWNRKWKRYEKQSLNPEQIFDKIVEYSTVPGTSRHHWGTDLDIIDSSASYSGDVLVPKKFHGDGPFCKMKDWMDQNAGKYGFALVYTMNEQRPGFKYEPWHWSYVPLSRKRYQQYLSNINLKQFLRIQDILGMDQVSDERIKKYLEEHLQGINSNLKQ